VRIKKDVGTVTTSSSSTTTATARNEEIIDCGTKKRTFKRVTRNNGKVDVNVHMLIFNGTLRSGRTEPLFQ